MRLRLALANNLPQKSLQTPISLCLNPLPTSVGIYVEFVAKPIEVISASSIPTNFAISASLMVCKPFETRATRRDAMDSRTLNEVVVWREGSTCHTTSSLKNYILSTYFVLSSKSLENLWYRIKCDTSELTTIL